MRPAAGGQGTLRALARRNPHPAPVPAARTGMPAHFSVSLAFIVVQKVDHYAHFTPKNVDSGPAFGPLCTLPRCLADLLADYYQRGLAYVGNSFLPLFRCRLDNVE